MEQRRKDSRSEVLIVDLEALVPEDHLLRKIEKVMDWHRITAMTTDDLEQILSC